MNDERTANIVDRRVGQKLRSRRLEIDMSQERLADILGITFQQIQKYEKGVNRIAASRLFDISQALDLPIGAFFEGAPVSKKAEGKSSIHEALATPEGVELMNLFASIKSRRVRRRVVDLVKVLSEGGPIP